MSDRRPMLLLALLLITAGCASKEGTAIAAPVDTKAPERVVSNSEKPQKSTLPPLVLPSAPIADKSQQAAFDAYSAKLDAILTANHAEATFKNDLKALAGKLDEKGFAVMIPVYQKYQKAVSETVRKLEALKPPKAAAAVHHAIVTTLDRLDENLDASIDAMKNENGDDATELSSERKKLLTEGAEALQDALAASHFDPNAFLNHAHLVIAPGK